MRVYVDSVPPLGLAMRRTALALRLTAPPEIQLVTDPAKADLQVLHAVDRDVKQHLTAPHYAVMMHCLDYEADPAGTGQNLKIPPAPSEPWAHVWQDARLVWSYYLLTERPFAWGSWSTRAGNWERGHDGTFYAVKQGKTVTPQAAPHFYFAPLGVDGATFVKRTTGTLSRDVGALTTGYVSGPQAEAIEEMALAAARAGLPTVHLGPASVGGMTASVPGWTSVTGISEADLCALYNRVRWVSGLRHGEGFELPVIEGLACGARPICFDLPCYRRWFDDFAAFVPDCAGQALIDALATVMAGPPRTVSPGERDKVLQEFNWLTIGQGFWRALLSVTSDLRPAGGTTPKLVRPPAPPPVALSRPASITVKEHRPKLLWIGDSPTTDWTGFGRASRHILRRLIEDYDVSVIGTTHDGSPYSREIYPYDIYPISCGVAETVTAVRPAIAVVQHDPWQVRAFMQACGNIPVIASMPIDGKNCRCDYLNGLAHAIWWTQFARDEGAAGGYQGPSSIIPLGVDTDVFKPVDKALARKSLGMPVEMAESFIVGYVARNQPRKRLDLAVHHFATWVKTQNVRDAYLYLQTSPTGEAAYDVSELMRYERLSNRLILTEQSYKQVIPEARMAVIYSALDVFWSTTQGEGFGLPALEAMACGTACVLPDWSAYGDWAAPAAHLVAIGDVSGTINATKPISGVKVAVYGAVPDIHANMAALDRVYRDHEYRRDLSSRGLALAHEPQYRWAAIGERFAEVIGACLDGPVVVAPGAETHV